MARKKQIDNKQLELLEWAFDTGFYEWYIGSFMHDIGPYVMKRGVLKNLKPLIKVSSILHNAFGKPRITKPYYRLITSDKKFTVGKPIAVKHIYPIMSWSETMGGVVSFAATASISLKRYAYVLVSKDTNLQPMFSFQYLRTCETMLNNIGVDVTLDLGPGNESLLKKQQEVVCYATTPVRCTAFEVPEYNGRNYSTLRSGTKKLMQKLERT